MLFLADGSPTVPDHDWLQQLMHMLGCIYFFKALYDKFKTIPEKPSQETKIALINSRLDEGKGVHEKLTKGLSAVRKRLGKLQIKQTHNTVNIESILNMLSELKSTEQQRDRSIERQLSAFRVELNTSIRAAFPTSVHVTSTECPP